MDLTPPEPFTQIELSAHRAKASAGEIPTLAIVRRFIATIRHSITSSPAKTEKTKVSRKTKVIIKEEDFNAF